MKYICTVCGYVYDDSKEQVPFAELPDDWVCPLCGASKDLFRAEEQEKPLLKSEQKDIHIEELKELSIGQLSAIFSNLARGCEKQYLAEEQALFFELAKYLDNISVDEQKPSVDNLLALLNEDVDYGYSNLNKEAKHQSDRGTQRICVWGEKVTNIVKSLLDRYKKEGGEFLKNKKVWLCTICGFIYVGDAPPQTCPVCKVPEWKFEEIRAEV